MPGKARRARRGREKSPGGRLRRAVAWAVGAGLGLAAAAWAGSAPQPLLPAEHADLATVVDHPTFVHTVIGVRFLSHPPLFEYFLDHPDVATAVARALRLSQYRIERQGAIYRAQDYADAEGRQARGMKGHFAVVHAAAGRRVIFVWGSYETALLTIRARAVLILDYRHHRDGGDTYAEAGLTGYVRIDHPVLALVARLLHPLLSQAMAKKVRKTFQLAAEISALAYQEPDDFLARLRRSGALSPSTLAALARCLRRAASEDGWVVAEEAPFRRTREKRQDPGSLREARSGPCGRHGTAAHAAPLETGPTRQ
ncbi:MAG: hypothetical protein KatS3mg131_2804 [Candidatus Tectimicrobiota bacterium]|nr:MAG: hypothetical protein KatS3mg131_2804 [Candidatus Tectomicrobia bacterium]